MGSLPVARAGDLGVGGLTRHLSEQKRDRAYRDTSRGKTRRGDYTGANVGPARLTDGTVVDDLLAQIDAAANDADDALARLGASQSAAALTLSSTFVAYTTIGAPTIRLLNGVAYLAGAVAPASGSNLTAGSTYTVGTLPYGAPGVQVNRRCTGQGGSSDTSVRGLVNVSGLVQVVIGAVVPAWIDLSALSAYLPAS